MMFPQTNHPVYNQAAPRVDINEYPANPALVEAVKAFPPHADARVFAEIGAHIWTADFQHASAVVNPQVPQLHTRPMGSPC